MNHQAGFFVWQLVVAMVLNGVVQAISIAAYAARLAGARSKRVGTAMSLYNLFVTTSRFASMIYTPMLGALSDGAVHGVVLSVLLLQLRSIVFSGAIGAVAGTIAIPTFVMLYLRGIRSFERNGNVVKAALHALRPTTMYAVVRDLRFGDFQSTFRFSLGGVPKDVIVSNTMVSAVYGIGIVSAAYASVLDPGAARTALLSSGLITGCAVIAYNVVVDPASALMTDQAARGERSIDDVKSLVTALSLTTIVGFLLSQVLLVPAAMIVARAASIVTGR